MFERVALNQSSPKYYQPRIARYTNTAHQQGTGSTRDTDMIPGANNWIRDHASSEAKNWELRGSSRSFVNVFYSLTSWTILALPINLIDFSQHTWAVNGLVRDKIGRDNEPVIVMYGVGTLGHFTMSQAYISHQGWFSATILLWITKNKGDMLEGKFVNITDAGAYHGGVFGLFRK